MSIINFEDGTKIEFFGTPTQEDVDEAHKQAKGVKKQSPNFFQRVGSQYAKAGRDIVSGIKRGGEIIEEGHAEAEASDTIGGQVAGAFKSIGGAGVSALRTVGGVAGAVFAPITEAPGIKQTLDFVADQIVKIPGVTNIVENAVELADKYPEQAKNIKNIVDIAVLVGGARTKTPADETAGKVVQKGGKALEESGKKSFVAKQKDFVRDLLRPSQTKKVKELQVPRTTETGKGIFKRSVIAPTKAEMRAEQAVLNIKGVSSSKTVQQNYNIISAANKQKAIALEQAIQANNFKIAPKDLLKTIDDIKVQFKASPLITGDAEKTANKLWNGMRNFLSKNERTGSGVLKARKQYDVWVKSQKPTVFNAKADSAFTVANREIRTGLNNLLEAKAPTLGIKQSLSEQSALFTAMNNLVPKAAIEADTAIGRAMQSIGQALGTKNKLVQATAAAAGIGGLGAAAKFAPSVAILGVPAFFIWRGGRYVLKPQVRIAIGNLLQKAGPVIGTADRTFLYGILSDYAEED